MAHLGKAVWEGWDKVTFLPFEKGNLLCFHQSFHSLPGTFLSGKLVKQKSGLGRRRGAHSGCQPFKFWNPSQKSEFLDGPSFSLIYIYICIFFSNFLWQTTDSCIMFYFELNVKGYYISSECQKFKHLDKVVLFQLCHS